MFEHHMSRDKAQKSIFANPFIHKVFGSLGISFGVVCAYSLANNNVCTSCPIDEWNILSPYFYSIISDEYTFNYYNGNRYPSMRYTRKYRTLFVLNCL